jgi:hypothetical protein
MKHRYLALFSLALAFGLSAHPGLAQDQARGLKAAHACYTPDHIPSYRMRLDQNSSTGGGNVCPHFLRISQGEGMAEDGAPVPRIQFEAPRQDGDRDRSQTDQADQAVYAYSGLQVDDICYEKNPRNASFWFVAWLDLSGPPYAEYRNGLTCRYYAEPQQP